MELVITIDINKIQPNRYQPRLEFDQKAENKVKETKKEEYNQSQ